MAHLIFGCYKTDAVVVSYSVRCLFAADSCFSGNDKSTLYQWMIHGRSSANAAELKVFMVAYVSIRLDIKDLAE